jgi:hypothetical protein
LLVAYRLPGAVLHVELRFTGADVVRRQGISIENLLTLPHAALWCRNVTWREFDEDRVLAAIKRRCRTQGRPLTDHEAERALAMIFRAVQEGDAPVRSVAALRTFARSRPWWRWLPRLANNHTHELPTPRAVPALTCPPTHRKVIITSHQEE